MGAQLDTCITEVQIRKVRHLQNITIPLAEDQRKHLILTGDNGCGKTSLLDALADFLRYAVSEDFLPEKECAAKLQAAQNALAELEQFGDAKLRQYEDGKRAVQTCAANLRHWTSGATVAVPSYADLREQYRSGDFVLAYYRDSRRLEVEISRSLEKIYLEPVYGIDDGPGKLLGKYLLDLRATQAFKRESERAKAIEAWFDRFQNILRDVYGDDTLTVEMDPETFQFSICPKGREPFGFNDMPAGYSALLAVIADLMLRMETKGGWDMEGIVLIDEVEAHLHLDMQRRVLPILTGLFPNVQFIVSTNSPFVLSSVSNAVVYDLTHHTLAEQGLTNLPYGGIVEGWFHADRLAQELREKYERYRALARQERLTHADYAEIAVLELYLDKILDYLALDIATEYERLKLELSRKAELE